MNYKVPELIFISPPTPYLLCLDRSYCPGKWRSIGRRTDWHGTSKSDSLRGEREVPFVRLNNSRSLRHPINTIMLFTCYDIHLPLQCGPGNENCREKHVNSKLLFPIPQDTERERERERESCL